MNKSETLLLSGKKESDKSVVLTAAKFQLSSRYYGIGYSADSDNAGSLSAVPFWYGKVSKSRYALTGIYAEGESMMEDYKHTLLLLTDKDGSGIASTNINDAKVLDSITIVRIDDPATVKTVTISGWHVDNTSDPVSVYSYPNGNPFGYADTSLAGKQFILTFDPPPPTDSCSRPRHLFGGVL